MIEEELVASWYSGRIYCCTCHYQWIAVAPEVAAIRGGLECPRCGELNGELGKEEKAEMLKEMKEKEGEEKCQ